MEFTEVVRRRRSIRGYLPEPVPAPLLSAVLEAARLAPSATNAQPIRLLVVEDPSIKESLRGAYDKSWFLSAPLVIAGCVEPDKAWKRADGFNAALLDIAIAFDHLTLAATDLGLGTCWVCNFDEAKAKAALGVPADVRLVAMTPLGFPDPKAPVRPFARKTPAEIVRQGRWT
jgi:nitroreductase